MGRSDARYFHVLLFNFAYSTISAQNISTHLSNIFAALTHHRVAYAGRLFVTYPPHQNLVSVPLGYSDNTSLHF